MFTSDIKDPHAKMEKTGFIYLFVSLFCVLFGAVYEYFSHEVYSYFMIYAFVIPQVGGVLPFFGMAYLNGGLLDGWSSDSFPGNYRVSVGN